MSRDPLDPFPLGDDDDAPVAKFSHLLSEGCMVRIKDTGHCGKFLFENRQGKYVVELDSGHTVLCSKNEIEPENFPLPVQRHRTASEKAFHKAHDPFGGMFDDGPSALEKKFEDVGVSPHDQAILLRCAENIRTGNVVTDLFGLGDEEEENHKNIRIILAKYADAGTGTSTSGGTTFAKAKGSPERFPTQHTLGPNEDYEFHQGQAVRDKRNGKKARITRLSWGFADLDYEGGGSGVTICDQLEAA